MDNRKSSDIAVEALLKIMVGDEVGATMTITLHQFGLIKRIAGINKYELTQKGLDRLNGV